MGLKLEKLYIFVCTISAQEVQMSPPILLWQTPRFSIPFQIQLVHTCASLPHSEARACWLWVVITLGFLGVAGVKGHVLSRGIPSQRMTSKAITMLLAPEMEHMGGYHVIILAAGVESPSSCNSYPSGPAVKSESGW